MKYVEYQDREQMTLLSVFINEQRGRITLHFRQDTCASCISGLTFTKKRGCPVQPTLKHSFPLPDKHRESTLQWMRKARALRNRIVRLRNKHGDGEKGCKRMKTMRYDLYASYWKPWSTTACIIGETVKLSRIMMNKNKESALLEPRILTD